MKKILFIILLTLAAYLFCGFCFAGPVYNPHGNINVAGKPGPSQWKRLPNLHILPINFDKAQLVVGQPFKIIVTVKNSSGYNIPVTQDVGGLTSEDRYGPSTHHGAPADSKNLGIPGTASGPTELVVRIGNGPGTTFQVPALAPGKTATFKKQYTATETGTLTISCTVDPTNRIKEANERDNTQRKVVQILGPDFRVVDFSVMPASVRVNDQMTIRAVVKNFGKAGASTFMRFDIHGDIPGTQDVILHPEVPVPFLEAGQQTTVTYRFTPLQPGTYLLGGGVNIPARTPESNEHNNSVPKLLKIKVKPAGVDLAVIGITTPHKRRHWYQNFNIDVIVKNIGNKPSGPFNIHFYRFHDIPAGSAQGTMIDMHKGCPSLGPNQICRRTFTFKYKIFVGSFTAHAKADPENQVNDINRANNEGTIKLTVF